MYVKAVAFLFIALTYEVNSLPFLNLLTGQDSGYSRRLTRQYGTYPNDATTYGQYSIDPATGQEYVTHYVTHSRPGGPLTALVQNTLNTVGRLVGDLGGALGNALGGTLSGAGQFGQDIQDFTKPITINQIVRPHPGPAPVRPVVRPPPPVAVRPPPPVVAAARPPPPPERPPPPTEYPVEDP